MDLNDFRLNMQEVHGSADLNRIKDVYAFVLLKFVKDPELGTN